MLYKIKVSREVNDKVVLEYYLTDAINFAYAGLKVVQLLGKNIDVEDVQMLKQYKPPINVYSSGNKVYIIKVAEDYTDENGERKTIKYPMPAFANNDKELYIAVKTYLAQGLQNMRLTTISETKWIYIK